MTVSFAEIREALDLVLAEAERRLGPVVACKPDYYWALPPDISDVDASPPEPSLGQLSDDIQSIRGFLTEREDGDHIIVWHELMHLCGVLRGIGVQAGP